MGLYLGLVLKGEYSNTLGMQFMSTNWEMPQENADLYRELLDTWKLTNYLNINQL